MGTREEDLRPAQLVADVVEKRPDAILGAEQLARDQIVAADDRLGPAEIDQGVAVLDPLDLADHDLADPVLELVVLPLALGLAHALDDDLLRTLRGDPAEVDRWQGIQDMVADLGRGVAHLRVLEPDLTGIVLDRVGNLELAIEPMLAGAPVDLGHDLVLGAVGAACGGLVGLLHGLEHLVDRDALFLRHGLDDAQHLRATEARTHVHRRHSLSTTSARLTVGPGKQSRRQGELGLFYCHERDPYCGTRLLDHDLVVFQTTHDAAKSLATLDRGFALDLGFETGEALEMLAMNQRPVEPRRADLERIGAVDRVGHVEHSGNRTADRGAIVDGHAAVTSNRLGRDLQCPPAAANHTHLHQLKAQVANGRLDQLRYLVKGRRPYAHGNAKRAGACPLSKSSQERMCAEYGGSCAVAQAVSQLQI